MTTNPQQTNLSPARAEQIRERLVEIDKERAVARARVELAVRRLRALARRRSA